MNTSVIRIGDIIRVDDGLPWYGIVRDTNPIRASMVGKGGLQAPRSVRPRQIVGHWRKSTATKKREEERVGN